MVFNIEAPDSQRIVPMTLVTSSSPLLTLFSFVCDVAQDSLDICFPLTSSLYKVVVVVSVVVMGHPRVADRNRFVEKKKEKAKKKKKA